MNVRLRAFVLMALLTIGATLASGASAESAQSGCHSARFHDFDFWLGTWTVRNSVGKLLGRSVVRSTQAGCAIADTWDGATGHTGESLSIYDAESGLWHETWVDGGGGLLMLAGGRVQRGDIVLRGRSPDRNARGGSFENSMRWIKLPDGRVRLHWQTSDDGGKNWRTAFDGYYSRAGPMQSGTQVRTTFKGGLPAFAAHGAPKLHMVEVTYPPSGATSAHRHPCPVTVYVIDGALREQVGSAPPTVVGAGQSFFEAANSVHAFSANASDKYAAKFLAIFICERETQLSVPVPRLPLRGGHLS